MIELPENIKSGDVARLFPVIAETGKERRAASILLSIISALPPLANALLSQIGQRIGPRADVNTFTEVVFKNEMDANTRDRPDGLIQVVTGKRSWSALVEAKIGKSDLESDQIERYLRLARDNGIDALITVSNEFAAVPSHHPVAVQKSLTKKVDLFHFSWSAILTQAVLMHEQSALGDPEQAFLLREFVRFLSHSSAGVTGFTSMPKEWASTVDRIQAGGSASKADGLVIVRAWHQEVRDLSLIMSRIISCPVAVKLPRAHVVDAERRCNDDILRLCNKGCLSTELEVPNAASSIQIMADLKSRSLRITMRVNAPKDKKTAKARINWLLRQIKSVDPADVYIGVIWASRASDTVIPLSELRDSLSKVEEANSGAEIRAFEVTLTSDSARRFAGMRTFIEELETLTPQFYEAVGQHLETWLPAPPKPKHTLISGPDVSEKPGAANADAIVQTKLPSAGNAHSELIEIPHFLLKAGQTRG